mgnify:CR=1 FL=1
MKNSVEICVNRKKYEAEENVRSENEGARKRAREREGERERESEKRKIGE